MLVATQLWYQGWFIVGSTVPHQSRFLLFLSIKGFIFQAQVVFENWVMRYILHIIWVNYNISLTWIKAIWRWFPLLTMIIVRSQWGRYNLPRYYCIYWLVASIPLKNMSSPVGTMTFPIDGIKIMFQTTNQYIYIYIYIYCHIVISCLCLYYRQSPKSIAETIAVLQCRFTPNHPNCCTSGQLFCQGIAWDSTSATINGGFNDLLWFNNGLTLVNRMIMGYILW